MKKKDAQEIAQARLKKKNYFQTTWQLWLMLLPAIVYIFIFNYIPMYGIQLAFREYSYATGITGGKWAGLKYFKLYFDNAMFKTTLFNTFKIAAISIVLGFPAPIILALILNQIKNKIWKKTMQTTVYIPYFISVVVMVSMLNIMLANSSGVVGNFLKVVHLVPKKMNLLGDPKAFIPVYVISGIWQSMGWNSIIYLAALSAIDPELYDAAKVDGASKWQTIIHIDLPCILPTIIILLILNMGGILAVGFDKTYLMQNSLNLGVSEVISTYLYKVGVQSAQFSFGSAIGLFNTLVNFIFLVFANWISKRVSGSGLM